MKKYLTLIISSIFIIISCDVVDAPYITNNSIDPQDTTTNNFIKKVLIEDFTGHLCPNCPDAAREIDAIHDIFGNQIIAIAMHVSKSFARPYPASQAPSFQYDFRTQWGDEWDIFYGISDLGLPRGMVNRSGYPDNHKLGKDEWANTVTDELNKEIDFGITINSDANSITVNSEILNNNTGEYNIVICLTENNIINWQKDGQENVEDYQHNHILRSVLIDESLSNSSDYFTGEQIEKTLAYDLSVLEQFNIDYSTNTAEMGNGIAGDWNAANISIIAYIYNTITKEILQVEEAQLNN